MFEDRVKRLKSSMASPNYPALSKVQIDTAFSSLWGWFYEHAGSIPFSSLENPEFRAFLEQLGHPSISARDFIGTQLDTRYEQARTGAEAHIRDAQFFQVAADHWVSSFKGCSLVSITVNLPNRTTIFCGAVNSNFTEEVLWDTVTNVSGGGGATTLCAGVISNLKQSTMLPSLEDKYKWMVNLSCQLKGIQSLIENFFFSNLSLINTYSIVHKFTSFFEYNFSARATLHKYQMQEMDLPSLVHYDRYNFEGIIALRSALRLTVNDDSYKLLCSSNPEALKYADLIMDRNFWHDVQAASSLVKLINDMIQEMQTERPLVGQCLPLWKELWSKIKAWCTKYDIDETAAHEVFDKSFKEDYHPAWSAAFILDPLNLTKDTNGKYLPPYKRLTPEQDKDVDKLITRLLSPEEADVALNELRKWRSEGMDPIYAQAVQKKLLDPATGKMKIANPQISRLVWQKYLSKEFGTLGKVAVRLIFLHATAGAFKPNDSLLKWLEQYGRSRAGMKRAQKIIFVAAQAKLERRDFSCDEDKDGQLFAHGDVDELINETLDEHNETLLAHGAVHELSDVDAPNEMLHKRRDAFMDFFHLLM